MSPQIAEMSSTSSMKFEANTVATYQMLEKRVMELEQKVVKLSNENEEMKWFLQNNKSNLKHPKTNMVILPNIIKESSKNSANQKSEDDKEFGILRNDNNNPPTPKRAISNKNLKTLSNFQRKKLYEKWTKALNLELAKKKFTNAYDVRTFEIKVKEQTVWTQNEFKNIFEGKGEKNLSKKNHSDLSLSTIDFPYDELRALFMEVNFFIPKDGYQAKMWRTKRFKKSYNYGSEKCSLEKMSVYWNSTKQLLLLTFTLKAKASNDHEWLC